MFANLVFQNCHTAPKRLKGLTIAGKRQDDEQEDLLLAPKMVLVLAPKMVPVLGDFLGDADM